MSFLVEFFFNENIEASIFQSYKRLRKKGFLQILVEDKLLRDLKKLTKLHYSVNFK